MHYSSVLLALATAASASQTHMVKVGWNGQLAFSPDSVKAAAGDKLMFMFYPQNHSVAMGTVDKPCQPLSPTAAFSGYVPVTAAEGTAPKAFEVTVQNTQPMWFYCTQTDGDHCQNGMSMVVNTPSSNALQEYQTKAKQMKTIAPSQKGGGTWVAASSSSSGGSSTNSSSSPKSSNTGNAAGSTFANGGLIAGMAGAAAWAML